MNVDKPLPSRHRPTTDTMIFNAAALLPDLQGPFQDAPPRQLMRCDEEKAATIV
jgi:hypothetical protein